MTIAIIGAGLTGLTAAYELSQKGHQVTVFEKEAAAGGLAAGIKSRVDDYPRDWDNLDAFYRHLFVSDKHAIFLINRLGLESKLKYETIKTSVLSGEEIFRFDSPLSLLKLPGLNLADKLRAGLAVGWLRYLVGWEKLEKTTLADAAPRLFGQSVYEKLWEPLVVKKFGRYSSQINTAWLWARLKKRSKKLGYLEGSFQALIDRLVEEIEEKGGKIKLNTPVTKLFPPVVKFTPSGREGDEVKGSISKGQINKELLNLYSTGQVLGNFDIVISTLAPPLLDQISSTAEGRIYASPTDNSGGYSQKLKRFPSVGAMSLILALKQPLLTDGTYWLNVNNQKFPFLSVVEHTNFQPISHYGGCHIVYIGDYYDQPGAYQGKTADELINNFLSYLKKLNPAFEKSWVVKKWLFTNNLAQPVFIPGYSDLMPALKTPVAGLYNASMWQVYPWDRGMNYAIELGKKVAVLIQQF